MQKNQRGFSLVEIMIAMGLLGVLVYSATKFLANQFKGQNDVSYRAERTAYLQEVRGQLSDPASCLNTFKNVDLSAAEKVSAINAIKTPDNKIRWKLTDATPATAYSNGMLRLKTLTFTYKPGDDESPSTSGNGRGIFSLLITNNKEGIIPSSKPMEINISTKKNITTNALESCALVPDSTFPKSRQLMMLQYQLPSGTEGLNLISSWDKIPFNTTNYNGISGASLNASKAKLPAGTYFVSTSLFFKGDDNAIVKTRIARSSDNSILCHGSGNVFPNSDKDTEISKVDCVITLNAETEIELQGYSAGNNAWPRAASLGTETHGTMMIDRLE